MRDLLRPRTEVSQQRTEVSQPQTEVSQLRTKVSQRRPRGDRGASSLNYCALRFRRPLRRLMLRTLTERERRERPTSRDSHSTFPSGRDNITTDRKNAAPC